MPSIAELTEIDGAKTPLSIAVHVPKKSVYQEGLLGKVVSFKELPHFCSTMRVSIADHTKRSVNERESLIVVIVLLPEQQWADFDMATDKRVEGKRTAIFVVVGVHNDECIFGKGNEHEDPKDEGESIQDVMVRRVTSKGAIKDIKRGSAHIPKDNTKALQGKLADCGVHRNVCYLAFQNVGVVFGDVGTSPLYVLNSTFSNNPSYHDVVGGLSSSFGPSCLSPSPNTHSSIMNANDNKNGGTFSLYSFICHHVKVSQLLLGQQHDDDDKAVSVIDTSFCMFNNRYPHRATKMRQFLEGNYFAKQTLLIVALLGRCTVYDGVLTPSILVRSAIDDIQMKFANLSLDEVVWISIVILIFLFSIQRFGTAK
ncbi:hypothetical protein L7F22_023551 [Adiantum nelumboides]|nr:hypothetical protein [Adiantum nelumboides]